jgi:hypothetical protein
VDEGALVGLQAVSGQKRAHRGELVGRESIGFRVGQPKPTRAMFRRDGRGALERRDRFIPATPIFYLFTVQYDQVPPATLAMDGGIYAE